MLDIYLRALGLERWILNLRPLTWFTLLSGIIKCELCPLLRSKYIYTKEYSPNSEDSVDKPGDQEDFLSLALIRAVRIVSAKVCYTSRFVPSIAPTDLPHSLKKRRRYCEV